MKLNYTELKKTLEKEYEIRFDDSSLWIEEIDQYPHVFILHLPTFNLVLKLIDKSKIRCEDINSLYNDLENNEYIELPQKTAAGDYGVMYEGNLILLYKQLYPAINNPSPLWWARCLSSIHSLEFGNNYQKLTFKEIYDITLNLLINSKMYMDKNLRSKACYIFDSIEFDFSDNSNLVLCHNDPYNLNVLVDGNTYKMIDTDGMCISQKEFDIQKLIHNCALVTDDINELYLFWIKFKLNYERNFGKKINIDLLKNIYSCDLIRSLSWLIMVNNDIKRKDFERQKEQLKFYRESILNGTHTRILSML